VRDLDPRETVVADLAAWLTRVMQYSAEHPICANMGQKVLASIQRALRADTLVAFGVLHDGLTLDEGTPLGSAIGRGRLAPHLHSRGIVVVRFLAGVTLDELTQWLQIVLLPVDAIFDRGGVGRLLLDRGVSRVQVEEIAHDITDEERASQKRRKELRDFFATMVKNLLARRAQGIDIAKELLLLLDHPELAVTLLEDDPLGVSDAVAALCLMVRQESARTGEDLFPKLVPILGALSPASQDRVLLGLPSLVGEFRDSTAWALRLLSDEDLARFVFSSFRLRGSELDLVFYAVGVAIGHDGRRRAVLRRMALFFYDLPSEDVAATELLALAARPPNDFDSYRQDRECLVEHARAARDRRTLSWSTMSQPPPRPSNAPPPPPRPSFDARVTIAEVVRLAARTRRFDRLSAHLPTAAALLVDAGRVDAVLGIVEALRAITGETWRDHAAKALRELLSTSVVRHLLDDFDRASAHEGADVDELTTTVKTLAIMQPEALLDRLEATDNRKLRRILLDALPHAGAALLPLVRNKLRSPSWFVVRNAIVLLTRSGGTPRDLLVVARHPNERVRMEITRALRAFPLDETTVEIASAYLGDTASEVRTLSRGLIKGELANATAIAVLGRIAGDEHATDEARTVAIDALGRSSRDEAAVALFELLQPRGLIDLGSTRDRAAAALRVSKAPRAAELFQSGLQSSVWRVRKVCERANGMTK
jgi:hypothetical protein